MFRQFFTFIPEETRAKRGLLLLVTAIITAGIAQTLLFLAFQWPEFWEFQDWFSPNNRSTPLPGFLLYIVGAWMFLRAIKMLGHVSGHLDISTVEFPISSPHFGFWFTCGGLAALLAYLVTTSSTYIHGSILTGMWLASLVLLIINVGMNTNWRSPSFKTVSHWLRNHLLDVASLTGIILLAFIIRFWNLELHPYSFMNDEGEMGKTALCILQGNCTNPFEIRWAGQPMLAFFPTSISIALLGNTALAVRLVSVLIGTLSVAAVYIITREVFGQKEAWLSAVLLATLPVHVHFSRLGVDNIIDSLSTTVVLGLLFLGMKRGSTLSFLAAGIVGGLCIYTYPGTRLAPILGLTAISYTVLKRQGFIKAQIRNIIIFIFSFFITAAPIIAYFYANPNVFFARMNAENIFRNHGITTETAAGILIPQYMKSSLVYILTSAPTGFFNSPKPYLTPLAAIFFIFGLSYTIWHIREERYFILFIWFWAAIVLGSTLTGGPPTSQRMLMSMPALAIITAIGICKITEHIPHPVGSYNWREVFVLITLASLIGYAGVRFYHYEYRVNHYFEDPSNEITYETASIISLLQNDGRFYLLADKQVNYLAFASFYYFSPGVEKAYFDISTQSVTELPLDREMLFVATPDRLDDLKKIRSLMPGGEWNEIPRRYQPSSMLYYSYIIQSLDLQGNKP